MDLIGLKMNCRLLYLTGQLGGGGLERQLYYLLKNMDRNRYRPGIIVWNYSEDDVYLKPIRDLGVAIFPFRNSLSRTTKLVSMRSLVRILRPEILHSCSLYSNFLAHLAVIGTGTIAIGSIRSDFLLEKREAGIWLGSLSARWPRVQISNNAAAPENIARTDTLFAPRSVVFVRNGVDLNKFQYTSTPQSSVPLIIGVGSLTGIKRWDRLMRAAGALKRQGVAFMMKIAGEGPLRSSLQEQASAFNLAECVEFPGYLRDLMPLFEKASLLVHTSDSEGCPNVILEAMACGRPVVATRVGDIPSLIKDGETGFLVAPDDDQGLLDRINRLLSDIDLREAMGRAARRKAERELGLERLVTETFNAYRTAGWGNTEAGIQ
jgi:glycosyltransferase involved in cell wall biosynthesis